MTSQPQPAPGDGRSAGQVLRPLRDIAAWALVAAPAVLLFVAVIRLIPAGDGESFGSRTQDSFYGFVNVATVFFPLAAVLLAVLVQPRHPKAGLITMIALVEYAAAAFFGVIFGVLVGLINIAGFSVRSAFEEFLARVAWLAVFGVAAWAVYSLWRSLFHVAKPKPPPGVYGQPQYGMPGAYPGQPGYGPPPGQPAQPGQPTWNQQAPMYGQPPVPPHGQPGQPGQPPQAPPPGWGQQPAAPPPSGAPTVPGMYGSPAFSEPTQVVPGMQPASAPPAPSSAPPAPASPPPVPDRTQMLPDDRPGFGPAGQDPPRH